MKGVNTKMIKVTKNGILLKKTELDFESEGVLNPAVIAEGSVIHLFYRAVAKGNYSSIGHCILSDPLTVTERSEKPVMIPEYDYESHGIEDPRLSLLDGLYYLTYTAFDGVNARGALATSDDLIHFKKEGIIVPQITLREYCRLTGYPKGSSTQYLKCNEHKGFPNEDNMEALLWDKNLIFFPKRINGRLYFLHRIKPEIQIASVYNLSELTPKYWTAYFRDYQKHILLKPRYDHEAAYIGGGCPPVETEAGWLMIYHGVQDTAAGYVYAACAALLDLHKPEVEIARLPYPLFTPEIFWEQRGKVNNVCFPTGTLLSGDTLYIYYGAADEQIASASLSLSELIVELNHYKHENEKLPSRK